MRRPFRYKMPKLNEKNCLVCSPWLATAFPALNGDNWLLTRKFAFIDLFFFRLLA
jgi:hypothetical protein